MDLDILHYRRLSKISMRPCSSIHCWS